MMSMSALLLACPSLVMALNTENKAKAKNLLSSQLNAQMEGKLSNSQQSINDLSQAQKISKIQGLGQVAESVQAQTQMQFREATNQELMDACKAGDVVEAEWPGDRKIYRATIVRVFQHNGTMEVRWTDGDTRHKVINVEAASKIKSNTPCVRIHMHEFIWKCSGTGAGVTWSQEPGAVSVGGQEEKGVRYDSINDQTTGWVAGYQYDGFIQNPACPFYKTKDAEDGSFEMLIYAGYRYFRYPAMIDAVPLK